METYHKIQTLFKRDMDGSLTGKKGKMIRGQWSTPELEFLAPLKWSFSEKVDGTNIRVRLRLVKDSKGDYLIVEYGGRSDNAVIPKPLLLWLEENFPTMPMWRRDLQQPPYGDRWLALIVWMQENDLEVVTLFGEGYGAKIQNGGNYRQDQAFVLFDAKIGEFWLDRANVKDVGEKLGLEVVPEIGTGTLQDAIDIVSSGLTFNKAGAAVRWGSGGLQSRWGNFEAEGIVARPLVPLFDRKGQRIITKIKGVDFK